MRSHSMSIAVAHLDTNDWTVAVVQTTYLLGVKVDARMVYGPIWCRESELQRHVGHAVRVLQRLVREHEVRRAVEAS